MVTSADGSSAGMPKLAGSRRASSGAMATLILAVFAVADGQGEGWGRWLWLRWAAAFFGKAPDGWLRSRLQGWVVHSALPCLPGP
jgi:hypothetical protein